MDLDLAQWEDDLESDDHEEIIEEDDEDEDSTKKNPLPNKKRLGPELKDRPFHIEGHIRPFKRDDAGHITEIMIDCGDKRYPIFMDAVGKALANLCWKEIFAIGVERYGAEDRIYFEVRNYL